MASEVERFEQELRSKVSHKAPHSQAEEGYLVKQFKFFDIYNSGFLSFDNFYRTVEKVGIIKDKEEVKAVYPQLAGVGENGEVSYRQFAKALYSSNYAPPSSSKGLTYSPTKHGVMDEKDRSQSSYQILRSGMNSKDYPLATTTEYYRPSTGAGRKSVMNPDYVNQQAYESLNANLNDPSYDGPQDSEPEPSVQSEGPIVYNYGHEPEYYKHNVYSHKTAPKSQILYIERFKEALNERGGRGIVGLLKQFKLFDTDQSGYLDQYEFKKAVDDYEVNVHPKDLDNLFNSFDSDGNGRIEYNEFLQALAGAMNKYRLQVVERAFDKLDRDGAGEIDINDMLACFDPYRHPDVSAGKNDPEGAYNEFKDTFETYHNVIHDYNSSAKVSRDEFTDFYTFLSSQYENDAQFDIMVNGVWNLDNKNNYEEMPYAGAPQKITKVDAHSQWLNDHHRRMFGGDDSLYAKGQVSWQTTHQAKYRTDVDAPNVTAGVPTWPIGANNNWEGGQMHEDQRVSAYYNAPHHYSHQGYQ
jgi:Ca2+-binding EF-hand superfamily protein